MAKKLIFVWLSITIIACSSISIYATNQTEETKTNEQTVLASEISEKVASRTIKNLTAIVEEATQDAEAEIKAAKIKAEEERKEAESANLIKGIASYITYINSNVGITQAKEMARYFVNAANSNNVDVYYLVAIAKHESCFYTDVISSAGCKGLMQTSDVLANKYGYSGSDAYNAQTAVTIGAKYLRECLDILGGDYMDALSGYAYGCGAVQSGNFNYGYANDFTEIRTQLKSYLTQNGYI